MQTLHGPKGLDDALGFVVYHNLPVQNARGDAGTGRGDGRRSSPPLGIHAGVGYFVDLQSGACRGSLPPGIHAGASMVGGRRRGACRRHSALGIALRATARPVTRCNASLPRTAPLPHTTLLPRRACMHCGLHPRVSEESAGPIAWLTVEAQAEPYCIQRQRSSVRGVVATTREDAETGVQAGSTRGASHPAAAHPAAGYAALVCRRRRGR
eukprot:scaffold2388_cov79-Isochrysis_galbana.AAC.1